MTGVTRRRSSDSSERAWMLARRTLQILSLAVLFACSGQQTPTSSSASPATAKPAPVVSQTAPPTTTTPTPADTPVAKASPAATSSSGINVGDDVVAPWGLSKVIATVTKVDGDKVTVKYSDDTDGTVTVAECQILKAQEWKVGDVIQARWTDSNIYPGKIKAGAGPGKYVIAWDDGSPDLTVEAKYILGPEPK